MANRRAGTVLHLAVSIALGIVLPRASAQTIDAPTPQASPGDAKPAPAKRESGNAKIKERYLVSKFPDKPSVPPSFSIRLEPLGYSAPGAGYLGARNALASLHFLDESHLLFTFRVPGLQHRDAASGEEGIERQIRAVVLTLPQGAMAAEAQWTVHDRERYLWALKNGHFLFRDRSHLFEGDATLALKPLLDFPGDVLTLDFDSGQQYMVTNSHEPAATPAKPADDATLARPGTDTDGSSTAGSKPGEVTSPGTASASIAMDGDAGHRSSDAEFVVRILRRSSGEVLLVSRVRAPVHLPVNAEGYVENLRGRGGEWVLNLSYFTGGSRTLGGVESACPPDDTFLTEDVILATGCGPEGESKLVAMTTAGRTLWASQAPPTMVWPQLAVAANGLRFAWETLDVDHAVNSFAPMDDGDVKEQSVTVFDAASGNIALVSPVSPVLDVGGNVAVSPSGRRVALLNAGAVQVFDLPAPPQLPVPNP